MNHFSLRVTAISPLAIRADHAPGSAKNALFINGSTLLGSLAAVHRLFFPDREEEFARLFLQENIHYPNLYPATFKSSSLQEASSPVYPLPKTAQSCKRFAGFDKLADDDTDDADAPHGIRDSLLDWAVFKIGSTSKKGNIAFLPALTHLKDCPTCKEPLDHFDGFYRRDEYGPSQAGKAKPETRLQTHTGINRETGIVEEGILYNRLVFEEDTPFWGLLKVDDQVLATFQDFIYEGKDRNEAILSDTIQNFLRIGTSRTRGLGKVAFEIRLLHDEQDKFTAFKERLKLFHQALKARAEQYSITPSKPYYFALTLHAPLILQDELLRYRGTIPGNTFTELLGLSSTVPVGTFQQIYQMASVRRVTGWHELWGTPRTNEYAIDTGSVFLFSSSLEPDDSWLRPLFELEEHGLGKRCAEGFGRIVISDPFHREGDLHWTKK